MPVFFHNLKVYDGHLIIREAFKTKQEISDKDISAIPNSNEKFMSFKIGDMKFIDYFAFSGESLEKLVKNLNDKEDK